MSWESSISCVVICTRNRPTDLQTAISFVRKTDSGIPILVADSSEPITASRVEGIVDDDRDTSLVTCTPGLARQRNQAIDWLRREHPDIDIVHFIDDDTQVGPDYFRVIESRFAETPDLAGVGGVVTNQERPRFVLPKRIFALYSNTPGRVLSSGRTTIGHYPGSEAAEPDWLPGCCMSYRLSLVGALTFDNRLEGYSWGEDFDFSFRLSRRHPLAIAREARVVHAKSETNRLARTDLFSVKVALLHRWVRENRAHGLRLSSFWLSVAGEAVLRMIDAVVGRRPAYAKESVAIVRAALHTLRNPLAARAHEESPAA